MKTLDPATTGNTLEQLMDKRKAALRNMKQQCRRTMEAEGTSRDIRVRPELWQQVANDYYKQILEERKRLKQL